MLKLALGETELEGATGPVVSVVFSASLTVTSASTDFLPSGAVSRDADESFFTSAYSSRSGITVMLTSSPSDMFVKAARSKAGRLGRDIEVLLAGFFGRGNVTACSTVVSGDALDNGAAGSFSGCSVTLSNEFSVACGFAAAGDDCGIVVASCVTEVGVVAPGSLDEVARVAELLDGVEEPACGVVTKELLVCLATALLVVCVAAS